MIVKNVEKKEHSTAVFQVEVDAETFEKALEAAYRRAKNSIYVAGFRKGKAPRTVIEGMYGADVFHDDAAQLIAPEAFDFGVTEAKLDSVGAPSMVDYQVDDGKNLTITFSTEVYPEVTLGEYKGMEAVYTEPEVTDAEVEGELEAVRKRSARFVDVDRPIRKGDTVVFDFEGFMDGEAFPGGKSENYTLEVGSGTFIPGFEDGLAGMAPDTEGEVHVTFPENYDEKLAGKPAVFKVKIHTVREPQYPELDDEFAKDVSEYDTLEDYKAGIRKEIRAQKQEEADREFKDGIINAALENLTCEVPDGMVAEKADEFLRNYASSIGMPAGASRGELLKTLGMDENSFAQMVRPGALKQVMADLLMDAVAKAEGIEVTQEDKDAFFKKIDEDYGEQAEKVKGMVSDELMVRSLTRQKAEELLVANGVKKAPEAEQAAEEAAPAAPAENQD